MSETVARFERAVQNLFVAREMAIDAASRRGDSDSYVTREAVRLAERRAAVCVAEYEDARSAIERIISWGIKAQRNKFPPFVRSEDQAPRKLARVSRCAA